MTHFMCKTCGTQFAATETVPAHCPICEDERQYIGWKGQQWTTLADLQADHHNVIKTEEPNLTGIGTHPGFAIGQRALLVQTPEGNLLWVMRPDTAVAFWQGETKSLWAGMTLIRGGGHFDGGTVLHWPAGADGKGVLLTGDILQVVSGESKTAVSLLLETAVLFYTVYFCSAAINACASATGRMA